MGDPEDPLDFADVLVHGDPGKWKYLGQKPGSPVPANSPDASAGTRKYYDLYEDEFGDSIELHYFRDSDGSLGEVKVID